MSSAVQKVSFTVRRPTPISRASSGPESDSGSFKHPPLPRHLVVSNDSTPLGSPLARSAASSPKPAYHEQDSSDEGEAIEDELVTGFDRFGVQRLHRHKEVKQGPLVIPALQNRDWRELARKRRNATQYVPASAKAETGKDGSVGGLGTRDTINSGPVLSGLQIKQREVVENESEQVVSEVDVKMEDVKVEESEDSEDQIALRAILAETNGIAHDGPVIDIIPTPISEADALKQDVEELPDAATLEDYDRVPVSQFGAALLRGMGWKEGTAASRKPGKGLVEPYLPSARPALLGIGAKEREILDDGSKKRNGGKLRPERRYVPIIKKETEGNSNSSSDRVDRQRSSPKRSLTSSRRSSRSPRRYKDDDERRKDSRRDRDYYDRERSYDRDRDRKSGSERDRRRDY